MKIKLVDEEIKKKNSEDLNEFLFFKN